MGLLSFVARKVKKFGEHLPGAVKKIVDVGEKVVKTAGKVAGYVETGLKYGAKGADMVGLGKVGDVFRAGSNVAGAVKDITRGDGVGALKHEWNAFKNIGKIIT